MKRVVAKKPQRFGGRATAGGVDYEVKIAALIATKMLAGDRCVVWDGVSGGDITVITMQAPESVDDIVVMLRGNGARVFISAKSRARAIPLTAKSPAFTETVVAFVRQFLKQPDADREKSRLIWAIPSSAGRRATEHLAGSLDSFRLDAGDAGLDDFLTARLAPERNALKALLSEVRKCWEKESGNAPSDEELRIFLRQVYIEVYDFDAGSRLERQAESDLRAHVLADPRQARTAWDKLKQIFAETDRRGVRVASASLRAALAEVGITFKSPPDYAEDIALVNELTRRNISRLKDHTTLTFGHKAEDAIHIARTDELSSLTAAAKAGHLLLTGEPGCGKSGLIHSLVERLQNEDFPVVLLLAEDVFGRDWKGSANLPGLKHALDDVLAHWPDGQRGFLITDALDAVRDVEMQKLLRRLLLDIKEGTAGWTVVASVREFDLKHSRELREAFPGEGASSHRSKEFAGVAHFHLTALADHDLNELATIRPDIRPFIESAGKYPKSGGIHHSPFFLRLAAELLRDGVTPARLADWNSPAVLLRRFWEARVTCEPGSAERETTLQSICRHMLDARSTTVSIKELTLTATDRNTIPDLRSKGILQSPLLKFDTRVGDEDIRFSHHLLHDYAIARALIPSTPTRFAEFAIREPRLPVFYRQSFVFALEELWDSRDGPEGFWSCALKLEGITRLHGIARILAPLLSARRVESFPDLRPLLEAVGSATEADSAAQNALRHLASGLQDTDPEAIRFGVDAWCEFVLRLGRLLPTHPFIESPLVQMLARLNTIEPQDERATLALNAAGRALLDHHVAKPVSEGWRYAAGTAIEAICRTFDAAPRESERALLSLLAPERLAHFPHYDLFDLAHSIEHLGPSGDNVVLRLFEAAFSTDPESGQWEDFGTRILPMRMQTSDNWNSIHYSLAGYYQKQSGQNPRLMAELACIAWNAAVRRRGDRRNNPDNTVAQIQFRGVSCDLVEDYGHIWGRDFEHDENLIVSHFESLLKGWAGEGDIDRLNAALDGIAARNRSSLMWTILLEVGAEHPSTLGHLLEGVLTESLFITHPDYCYGGIALFGALHKHGRTSRRQRLEQIILDLPEQARFLHDEPRDPPPAWLVNTQNRLLAALEESNIVFDGVREWRRKAKAENGLLPNRKRQRPVVNSSVMSDEERLAMDGIDVKEPGNANLFKLRKALKLFLRRDGNKPEVAQIEEHWDVIARSERAVQRSKGAPSRMADDVWGHLVAACDTVAQYAEWPKTDDRWKTVRRILLKAANDPEPMVSDEDEEKDDCWPVWGWPSPRLDAARGLAFIAYRLGRADKQVATALRRLSRDPHHALRFNLAERVALLSEADTDLMWEITDAFVSEERKFSVLDMLVLSLDRLWNADPPEVMRRLRAISERALRSAPPSNGIHQNLARVHLFRSLRTGDDECATFISRLIEECDTERTSQALLPQFHTCRAGGWLTAGDGTPPDPQADAIRARTWNFFSRLLTAAQSKLNQYREEWTKLAERGSPEEKDDLDALQAGINRMLQLVDGVTSQLYFASGAFDEKRSKDEARLSPIQMKRYWQEASPLLDALANEPHPNIAYEVVQTLQHLMSYAPRETFLMSVKSINNSAKAGFHHEHLAVGEVVKLIQRALADHRDIFQNDTGEESECLDALLQVLDLFVEAGWKEARDLTHKLEDIYK